jgi:hypothetical protein
VAPVAAWLGWERRRRLVGAGKPGRRSRRRDGVPAMADRRFLGVGTVLATTRVFSPRSGGSGAGLVCHPCGRLPGRGCSVRCLQIRGGGGVPRMGVDGAATSPMVVAVCWTWALCPDLTMVIGKGLSDEVGWTLVSGGGAA